MLVSKPHKKLLLNLNEPDRVVGIVPGARMVSIKGHDIVSVPFDLDTVRVLRNLGINAPGPILHYYDWPGRFSPFAHQRETAEFCSLNPRAYILNDMGTGKTASVLWAYDYLRKQGVVDWALVISPLSTLERTWADEVFRNFPDMSYGVVYGTPERRMRIAKDKYDIYIINHDGIKSKALLEYFAKKEGNGLIIIDELASFRNASTDRWKCLNYLVNGNAKAGVPPKEWVWGLTGTPIPNEPTDAWAQCRLITPGAVPKYFNAFRDVTMRQITQYKWFAKSDALDQVFRVMRPAIRFNREDCIDLPPTTYTDRVVELSKEQTKMYKEMVSKFKAEYEGGQITAVNEAVKLNKLLQICCLRYDTNVLTRRGWVEIQCVQRDDLVWDGLEWVSHDGAILMGHKPTIQCGGVHMTEDHLVLSSAGWVTAKEFNDGNASKRLEWAEVRLPDSGGQGWKLGGCQQESPMVVPVPVWGASGSGESVSESKAPIAAAKLRVSPWESDPQYVSDTTLPDMGQYAETLRGQKGQGLGELRGAWHNGVRLLARFVRGILGRHEGWLHQRVDFGQSRQQWALFPTKLPMGDTRTAGQQPTFKYCGEHTVGVNDDVRGSKSLRDQASDVVCQGGSVRLAPGESPDYPGVYDIINCGPRNRFVVRGEDGAPRIVHNCGVAYGPDGDMVIPAKPRIDTVLEVVEESKAKVIVFVPLTGALNALADAVGKHYKVSVVHGQVSKSQRDEIFHDFMQPQGAKVLIAQPGTMAHGLSLTAADTICWYAPTNSSETYQQANARIVRPGQKRNTLIVRVQGSDIERRMYERLERRESMQGTLLGMFE